MAQGDTGMAERWDTAWDRNRTPTAQGDTDTT